MDDEPSSAKDENGKPIGCFVGVGTNGNPNDMGKGV
jgi:hypothetical protein